MKYKVINENVFLVVYDDNTGMLINIYSDNLEENLKDAYILSKNKANRVKLEDIPTDLQEWNPNPQATTLKVIDWYNLRAKVYDQYGDLVETDVNFTVEGTSARIEDGKIVEDVVEEDTSYFIVAKYGDLEERQERFLYAPREVEPSEIDVLNNKIAELEELVEKQATTITNQAIAINKDRELLTQVDNDLNGLVGDVSE